MRQFNHLLSTDRQYLQLVEGAAGGAELQVCRDRDDAGQLLCPLSLLLRI